MKYSYLFTTIFPKGVNARRISLKCWLPKGMPTMVMVNSNPKSKWVNAMGIPPTKNQMIFMTNDRHPDDAGLDTTFLLNGKSATSANFNDCNPNGIPTMVTIMPTLETTYSTAITKPPNMIQMIFPRSLTGLQ